MQSKMLVSLLVLCGSAASAAGSFRVQPYLQAPTTQGVTINWFTVSDTPGQLEVSGGGLAAPVVVGSTPALTPVLDYQIAAELNAANFAASAVFDGGAPARNYKHTITLTGLTPGTTYTYRVTQGAALAEATFRTAPLATSRERVRMVVLSDSETLVSGRTTFREWARTTPQATGSTGRPPAVAGTQSQQRGRDRYFLTETVGYQENIKAIKLRNPDLIVMPGDLIEGTASEQQRRWDEFWRHNAGAYDTLASSRPIIAAIGNNCIFNGTGANTAATNQLISYARQQWSAYFDQPSNGNPAFSDLYFRQDFGPITILTLCSVKATDPANGGVAPTQGLAPLTQSAIRDTNRAWFGLPYAPADIPDFNIGTEQWNWAQAQLASARAENRIVFMQWHHTPFSRGVHGSNVTSNQSGEAMRIYMPVAEQFRVAGVFCGHSEVKERSFIDLDDDGFGVNLWDVGAAGDGLRGVEDAALGPVSAAVTNWRNNASNPQGAGWVMNPFAAWSADQDNRELWNGNQLISGGKHYGFLEVDVMPLSDGRVRITYQPFHIFPLNAGDADFTVTGYELRRYNDRVVMLGEPNNLRRVCEVEFDGQPGLSFDDLTVYVREWFAASAGADIDSDGSQTIEDVMSYVNQWFAGC